MREINCPECNSYMTPNTVDDLVIDVCPNCSGIFFDKNELGEVVDFSVALETNFSKIERGDDIKDHEGKDYTCAFCSNKMTEREYYYDSGIFIDVCEQCQSIYLNKNEIEQVVNFLESHNSEEGRIMEQTGTQIGEELDKKHEEIMKQFNVGIDGALLRTHPTLLGRIADFIFQKNNPNQQL